MRRIIPALLIFAFVCAFPARAEDFTVGARGAILMEAESGRVLYAQNADEMLPMASTTKIMTCLLALENAALDDKVTCGPNAYGTPGTSIYLSEGESLTMEQMLYGLMLRSGNDAAVAIAESVAGSETAFADMMNARAREIGADVNFVNPHGLPDDNHRASARGMALIMREAMKNPDFARISSTRKKIIPWVGNEYSRVLQNKNRLLTSYEGATGGKTGFTTAAGRCLVFSAEKDGMALIGCVLNCSSWFDTAEALLDYGYGEYSMKTLMEAGERAGKIEVAGGRGGAEIVASKALRLPVKDGENCELEIILPESAAAPVSKGAAAGRASAVINGKEAASVELIFARSVPVNDYENALRRVIGAWPVISDTPGTTP